MTSTNSATLPGQPWVSDAELSGQFFCNTCQLVYDRSVECMPALVIPRGEGVIQNPRRHRSDYRDGVQSEPAGEREGVIGGFVWRN